MRRIFPAVLVLFFVAIPLRLQGGRFEWQLTAGAWSLEPFTSPVAKAATRLIQEEVDDLLVPILSEFAFFTFQPRIQLSSRGYFFAVSTWYKLAAGKYALGISASYLHFTLPFRLSAEQDFFILDIPVAHVSTQGEGRLDLRTVMFKVQGRWRISHGRRISIFAGLGLSLMPFQGDYFLPLTVKVDSILGSVEFPYTENTTIARLRAENSDIPVLILSPALAVSMHYRLRTKTELLIELNLSPGTFISVGWGYGW